ncbi:MAG: hypothetical protein V4534_01035 [Myxococcota bacterium]
MLSFVECKKYLLLTVMAVVLAGGCSRKPIQSSGTLPTPYYRDVKVPEIEKHEMVINGPTASIEDLRAWNQKVGKPTFGLIAAFYQLPQSQLIGAVKMESGYSFGAGYQAITLKSAGPRPYAVLPASIGQTQVFTKTMNEMMDAGVKFVEVSMADANQIMRAEKKAIEDDAVWPLGQYLPSGVGYLISIEKGEGLYGPTYVGRVIGTSDGRLIALGTQLDAGPQSLEPLLKQLVSDALRRLADAQ